MDCPSSQPESSPNVELFRAARDGNCDRVRHWIANGATDLHYAITVAQHYEEWDVVSMLMKKELAESANFELQPVPGVPPNTVVVLVRRPKPAVV